MSILKPTDPSSAIKTLNGDSANTNSLINHALTVAASAYEKSEELDTVINGEKLKDPSGDDIYQRDDDGNVIYNNDGTPVIKRNSAGLVTIVASKASISQLEAESARIDTLEANSVTTETLNAEKARIDALETSKANIDDLNAEKARIDNLETNKADISTLNAEKARIDALETGKADISSLTAESARIDNLETNKADITSLNAETARIDNLIATKASAEALETESARIDTLESTKADITSLNAEIARIDSLETGKADIDLANVNNAWITNGVIKDASIANEKVISVSANKLTAGTIDASKITVTNLNADNITVGTINGARIGNSSIDLDKLSQEVPTKEYLDSVEQKLQEEIDGAIETFTVSEIPTLNNEPAVNWTTDDVKSAHVGDLCYVVNSSSDNDGFCYRFQYNGTAYSWALIKDNDVTKAIQDIAELGGEVTQFKTDYTSKVSEIDGGIESLKSRTTAIETSVSTKVETSVFNTLKNTVDENSANITSLAETVTTKADNSTVTTLSNTVNEVKQTADANSSSISSLATTVNTKADGSKVTELETKTSTIEQNLNGITTRVTNVEKDMATEEFVTSQGYLTVTSDAITSKVSKNEVISAINQTAESVSIDASKINLNGAVTFTSFDSSLQTTINNKAETSDLEAVRTTANNAQTSINNLEIGGRNLFIETDYENIKTQGPASARGWYNVTDIANSIVDDNSEKAAKTVGDSWAVAQYVNVEAGETYTMSCFARLETERSGAKLQFRPDVLQVYNLNFDKDLTTDYQKLTRTWTCRVGGIERIHIRTGNANDVLYVKKIKFEKGNKATDWAPAPEDVDAGIDNVWKKADNAQTSIDNLEIGGRNLFLNTGVAVSKNDYLITSYKYANEPLKEGEIYTAAICVTPAENLSEIRLYFSQGYLGAVRFYPNGTDKQVISETFTMAYYDGRTPDINPSYGYAQLFRFPNDGTVTGNTTVHWFKIEKGNKATDWTPAPEDVDASISAVSNKILSWCHENNQTLIDGAKIYTGSIDAESINVESLTADMAFIDEMETNLTRFKAVGENEYYETEITGEGIDFKYGTSEETSKTIAGISGDELQIKKTSVLDEMKIGKWSWKVNPNNSHLTLRWNGGDE